MRRRSSNCVVAATGQTGATDRCRAALQTGANGHIAQRRPAPAVDRGATLHATVRPCLLRTRTSGERRRPLAIAMSEMERSAPGADDVRLPTTAAEPRLRRQLQDRA